MRLAVLSDIHGNLPALEAVVRDMAHRGVERVVNLGDHVSGPLLPRETARFLMEQDWVQLAGNHERQLLTLCPGRGGSSDEFAHACLGSAELAWLASLSPTVRFSPGILLCHGTPSSDRDYLLETVDPAGIRNARAAEIEARAGDSWEVILCGHTHLPRCVRASGGRLILNPGSVGLPAYDDVSPHPHVVETGSPDARYAILERSGSAWIAELIAVPYAHEAMARLAKQHRREDWARALATGYLS